MIGVVTTSYPRGPGDWAGRFVEARVRALLASGACVEVVAAGPAGTDQVSDVQVIRVPSPSAALFYGAGAPEALEASGAAGTVAGLGFAARMAAAVAARAESWRAVESHWLVPSALVACAVAGGQPHRAFAHGGDVALLERMRGGRALARFLATSGAALVFASADLRARFARLSGLPDSALTATVSPAPFDDGLFRPRPAASRHELRSRLRCSGPTVLAVGRLVKVKGFDLLVRAVGRLPTAGRPVLVLVGEGPERGLLAQMAAARGVSLQMMGALPQHATAAWMVAADAYCQPSRVLPNGRGEGTPLAVREALACGLPTAVTAVGGMAELADAHPALTRAGKLRLVPPDDPAALAGALRSLPGLY